MRRDRDDRGDTGMLHSWRRRLGTVVLVAGGCLAGFGWPGPGAGAQPVYTVLTPHQDQGTLVSLSVTDRPISDAVREVMRQAHVRMLYNESHPALSRRITARITKASVFDALAIILKGTGLTASLAPDGETIMLRAGKEVTGHARARTAAGVVSGRVTDSASGKGIGGATVTVQGTTLRTTTAETGQFTLNDVPAGEQLVRVRAFGYKAAIEKVMVTDSERTTVQVVLRPAPTVLSGVVTTATGVQERRQLGNDITVLNADSIMRVAPVATVTDLLETRVPGLTVQHTSGVPGSPSRIRLRGTSSLTRSNDPIVVVDGVRVFADQSTANSVSEGEGSGAFYGPSPLDQIDPNSIETIEVFKGPSASAIYGSDAGNGVIVITTKRGRPGRARWDLALEGGSSALPGGGYPVNYFRFGHQYNGNQVDGVTQQCQAYNQIPGYSGGGQPCFQIDSVVAYQALNDPRFDVFGRGASRDASLTVSGGTGAMTYALTGSASHETGILQLPAFEVRRFQALHGFDAPDWMRHPDRMASWGASSRLGFSLGTSGGSVELTGKLFRSAQQQSSLQSVVSSLHNQYIDTANLATHLADPALGLVPDYYHRATFDTWTVTQGAVLQWPVLSWLPITGTAGFNFMNSDNANLLPRGYVVDPVLPDSIGSYQVAKQTQLEQTLEVRTAVHTSGTGRLPGVQLPVGFQWVGDQGTSFGGKQIGLPPGVDEPTELCGGENNSGSCTQAKVSQNTYGWYVAPTLDLHSRFFVSPGIRFDGGSASGQNANFSPFPKLDFSWLAIESPDRPVLGAITLLRPRLAFGIAGVQPAPGDHLRLFQPSTVTLPGGTDPLSVAPLSSLGNTRLRPERSRELEGGLDAELWNQRLTLTFTAYHKLRYDALYPVNVAPSVNGGGTITMNIGDVRNDGVNATVGARLLDTRQLSWNVQANITKNTNRLLSVAPGVPTVQILGGVDDGSRLVPGYPLFGRWAQPIVGYVDANHDGVIEPWEVQVGDSAVFVGAQEPNYELTGNTILSLFNGRVNVATTVDYQNGLTQTNTNLLGLDPLAPGLSQAQQAGIAALFSDKGAPSPRTDIAQIQVVNTLRWQSLSVNWQLPASAARWFRAGAMAIALQGSNLGLHTNYRGKDPNVTATPSGNSVSDTGQLPLPRIWQLRVTLGL